MNWNQVWSEYNTLIVVIVSVTMTMLATQILPWVWHNVVIRIWRAIGNRFSNRFLVRSFRKDYLSWLIEEHRYLEIRGLRTRTPVSIGLDRVYVSLKARYSSQKSKINSDHEVSFMPVLKILAQNQRVVILGDPGAGKTTFLRFLIVAFARLLRDDKQRGDNSKQLYRQLGEYWSSPRGKMFFLKDRSILFPLYVSLRTIDLSTVSTINDLATLFIGRYQKQNYPENFFAKLLQDGKCIVLLDGLDEVRGTESKRVIVEWIEDLISHYPNNKYVVTSRIVGYSSPLSNGFLTITLEDFSDADINSFVYNWYETVETYSKEYNDNVLEHARHASKVLIDTIHENEQIRRLAVNPLLLSIIALVHRYRTKLPDRRVELYDECVQVLLGHWDEAKGLGGELAPIKKRLLLEPLALRMQIDGTQQLSRLQVAEILEGELSRVGWSTKDVHGFIDEICERTGLLIERGANVFSFSHLTFQEYLVASHIYRCDMVDLLLQHVNEDQWHEITLLYSGMTDVSRLVNKILEMPEDFFDSKHLLAGQCIAEALQSSAQLRSDVVAKLQNRFTQSKFFLCGKHIVDVLRKLDEKYASRLIIERIQHSDGELRNDLVELLALIVDSVPVENYIQLIHTSDDELRIKLLGVVSLRRNWSNNLTDVVFEQLQSQNSLLRHAVLRSLRQRERIEINFDYLMHLLLNDDDETVRGLAAEILENCASPRTLAYLGLAAFDENAFVAMRSGDAILAILHKSSWSSRIHLPIRALGKLFSYVGRKELRRRSLLTICAALAGIFAIVVFLPVLPFLPFESDTKPIRFIRNIYWIIFKLVGVVGKSIMQRFSFSKGESIFYTTFYRGFLALSLGDARASTLMQPFLLHHKTSYQSIAICHPIMYEAKYTSELFRDLTEAFKSASIQDKWYVACHLERLSDVQALSTFSDLIEKSDDINTKKIAINAMLLVSKQLEVMHTHILLNTLNDDESSVREYACFVLGELRTKDSIDILHSLVTDKDVKVRVFACEALGKIGSVKSLTTLCSQLDNQDRTVTDAAYEALWKICRHNSITLPSVISPSAD